MRKHLLGILLLVALVVTRETTNAQTSNRFYSDLPVEAVAGNKLAKSYTKFRVVQVDLNACGQYALGYAAQKKSNVSAPGSITLPMPDGTDVLFNLTPTEVLVDELAAKYPEIQTFSGESVDKQYSLRLTISPYNIGGMIYGNNLKTYVHALDPKKPETVIAYDVRDVIVPPGIKCGTVAEPLDNTALHKDIHGVPLFGDCQLRTYKLAIAATGEYTGFHGGTVALSLAAITTVVNDVNAIYERDLAIHFTLVSNNNLIIYTNASVDPFSTAGFPNGTSLSENQTNTTTVIGSANFGLGMLFNAGGTGGLAQVGTVCGLGSKARAAAGISAPIGPIFENIVEHEMGHQFNANHSFAANNGSCAGNTNGATGWEPGGGSTIMAYAGSCTGNYYQFYGDNYFHGGNLAEMATYMTGTTGNSCATVTSSGNTAPVHSFTLTSFTIPNGTPFKLTSGGTDANASDVLKSTWEEMDPIGGTGTASPPSPTATSGPQFRSYPPSTIPTRYFPSLAILAGNVSGTYEVLPTVARTMNFRSTVRDNHSGAGCTASQDVVITAAACGPFSITSHTTGSTMIANGTNTTTLTWNTASACVTCANINVKFSTDGGLTFPYTVLSNTPNDGTQAIVIPNLPTCAGRFMIECASSIFFNINAANQTITSSCTANGTTFSPSADLSVAAAGNAALNMTETPQYGTAYILPISGSITSGDPAGTVTVYSSVTTACANFGGNATRYDTYTFTPSVSGSYTFTGSNSSLVYDLYNGSFDAANPCTNFIASSAIYDGTSATLGSSVAATLCAKQTYVLLVSSFASGSPALPAAYTVSLTPPASGSIYNGTPQPAGLNYCYVMVKNSTGAIVEINSNANLTNTTNYPVGNYTVYGISSSSTCTALNTSFAGQQFSVLNTAALNQTAGLCANLSANTRRIAIGGTVLSMNMLNFDATLRNNSQADVYWSMTQEKGMKEYELQRSVDGQHFETITTLPAYNSTSVMAQNYSFTDINIPRGISTMYYRLKMVSYSSSEFSGIIPLKLKATGSSVSVSPNPIQNDMLVANVVSAGDGKINASVYDMTGRVLVRQQLNTQEGDNRLTIYVGDLTPGMYLLRVETNGMIENIKFIKPL